MRTMLVVLLLSAAAQAASSKVGGAPPSAGGGGGGAVKKQPQPHINLGLGTLPRHGDAFDENSWFYDSVNKTIEIGGKVTGLPPNSNTWSVRVQGMQQPLLADANGYAEFSRMVSLATAQPSWIPFSTWIESERMMVGFVAELQAPGGRIVERDSMLLYDARYASDLYPHTPTGTALREVTAQLSPAGLGQLELPHVSSLFFPTKEAFVADLGTAVMNTPIVTTHPENSVCFEASEVPGIKDTAAWSAILAEANLIHASLLAVKQGDDACTALALAPLVAVACQTAVALAQDSFCVTDFPKLEDFDVCVDAIDLELETLAVSAVESVSLGISGNDTITAAPLLKTIDAEIIGRLDELTIRWEPMPVGCFIFPGKSELSSDDLDAVSDWRTCSDLRVDAPAATSPAIDFTVQPSQLDPETLSVTESGGAAFTLDNETHWTGIQMCSDTDIVAVTESGLVEMADSVADALSYAWGLRSPDTLHAGALQTLLEPFEVSTALPPRHELFVEFVSTSTDAADGLWMEALADAAPIGKSQLEPTTFFRRKPFDLFPLEDGLDDSGAPYDIAFSITTGHVNQVLRALTGTDALNGAPLRLTVSDLGGSSGRPARLDGQSLAHVDPVFAEIGQERVKLELSATLAPFTHMAVDNHPVGEYPVSYLVPHMRITLASAKRTWAVFSVDMWTPDLGLTWKRTSPWLEPDVGAPIWTWTPHVWNFATCPASPLATPALSCEQNAVASLARVLEPVLKRRFQALLANLPAPQTFDVGGHAGQIREVTATRWWREGQIMTFTGALD